jgi:SAM-dependent methyltransferase
MKTSQGRRQSKAGAGGDVEISTEYTSLAGVYDRLVGNAAFPIIRSSFEWALRRYAIEFESAADIGCGTGTFVRYLRRRHGVPVFGVDRSPQMLAVAAAKNRDPGALLIRQELQRLDLPAPVDLITCNFDTLNYFLDGQDLADVFRCCHRNLKDSGHFVFDVLTRTNSRQGWQICTQRIGIPGGTTVWSARWSQKAGLSIVEIAFILLDSGHPYRVLREVHLQKWFPLGLLKRLLRSAGFAIRGVLDLRHFGATTIRSSWLKYIVQKK